MTLLELTCADVRMCGCPNRQRTWVLLANYAVAVGRREQDRVELRSLAAAHWPTYLLEHSGLPGPRGNIELAQAVADEGGGTCFDRLITTDDEYLVFCGVVGLGRLLAEGADVERRLCEHAADARWRVREGVAMALQRLGDADLPRLLELVTRWAADTNALVQRAVIAGICEPRLLKTQDAVECATRTCAEMTHALAARTTDERRDAGVRALRQALGHCWSVAVAADPATRTLDIVL
jgi:hypothetical protein